MLNYLQGCSRQTTFGMIPDIINHNNEAIQNEFNYIYDASLNRLTKSVYAPMGSVKAHMGEFVNLSVEYITIKNIESLKDSIQQAVDEIIRTDTANHNFLNGRFKNPSDACLYSDDTCHDANSIGYTPTMTVEQAITDLYGKNVSITEVTDNINSSINNINDKLLKQDVSITDIALTANDAYNNASIALDKIDICNVSIDSIKSDLSVISAKVDSYDASMTKMSTDVSNAVTLANSVNTRVSGYDTSMAIMNASVIDANNKADNAQTTATAAAASVSRYDTSLSIMNTSIKQIDNQAYTATVVAKGCKSEIDDVINPSINRLIANDTLQDTNIAQLQQNMQISNTSINQIFGKLKKVDVSLTDINDIAICADKRSYDNLQAINIINNSIGLMDASIGNMFNTVNYLDNKITNVSTSLDTTNVIVGKLNTDLTNISKNVQTINGSIGKLDASAKAADNHINLHETQITVNANAISTINNKIQIIDTSINDVSQSLFDLSFAIHEGSFQIAHRGYTYTITSLVSKILELYNWYQGLESRTITYKDASDNVHTITVICESGTAQIVSLANGGLGVLTGDNTPITNPGEYTQADISATNLHINNLIGNRL